MSQSNTVRHLELVGRRPAAKLPQYLFKRGYTHCFKRKIPAGAGDAFPGFKEQVWKSLETNLLATAKVRLAVEVTHLALAADPLDAFVTDLVTGPGLADRRTMPW